MEHYSHHKDRMVENPNLPNMMIWVMRPGKELRTVEVLAEGKSNIEQRRKPERPTTPSRLITEKI